MKNSVKKLISVLSGCVMFCFAGFSQSEIIHYSTLTYPGAANTFAYGVTTTNFLWWTFTKKVVGWATKEVDLQSHHYGFLHKSSNFQNLEVPNTVRTDAYGISGDNIVGGCWSNNWVGFGFVYNGSTYSTFQASFQGTVTTRTAAHAIDGAAVVGEWEDNNRHTWGFLYNIPTSRTVMLIKVPDSLSPNNVATTACGISGNNIVGYYGNYDPSSNFLKNHAFIYDGTIYRNIDFPGAKDSYAMGIQGTTIVGYYSDSEGKSHGFIKAGSNYRSFDIPGAAETWINAINGTVIVGTYLDSNGFKHGFINDGRLILRRISKPTLQSGNQIIKP